MYRIRIGRTENFQCRRSNRLGNSQATGPILVKNSGERRRRSAEGIMISGKKVEGASQRGQFWRVWVDAGKFPNGTG